MAALFATILIASLVGSLHCAGMCGAFLAFAIGVDPAERRSRFRLQAAYHFGRLATYTTLGAAAGSVGAVFDLAGRTVGLQRAAMAGSAIVIAGFGIITLARALGVRVPRAPVPAVLTTTLARAHTRLATQPPMFRALSVGLLTTLLPCGWLYAFVAVAAGTAHPGLGAAAMAAFWVGTLPVMVALGFAVHRIGGSLGKRLPVVASSALIVVAVGSLVSRSSLIDRASGTEPTMDPMARVQELLDSSGAPCHAGH
jgi:sulfite exporter TauE/SafE